MDYDRMDERLRGFLELCDRYDALPRNNYTPAHRAAQDQITVEIPTVKAILKVLDPDLTDEVSGPLYAVGMSDSRRAVQQALGILRDREELREMLAPDSPSIAADALHPRVWGAASTLWGDGHRRVALQTAATAVSLHIADRAESGLGEGKLVQAVFAPDAPTEKQPTRLHLPSEASHDNWYGKQQGLHWLAQGAFSGIRNPSTHNLDEYPEQVALAQLAVLSTVARWTDLTALIRWAPSHRES